MNDSTARATWRDYLEITKPRVVALMTFTALIGMVMADPLMQNLAKMFAGTIGITLMAAAAASINQVTDRHIDAKMSRTQGRPLPRGVLSVRRAMLFALLLGSLGFGILNHYVNVLTAWLTFGSLTGYAMVYTLYLKRATPQNIVIGGAAGATPPLLGWTTVTGAIEPGAMVLFLIIFIWTPPHFWALALHRKEDYAKMGIPMLPVTHGDNYTRLQVTLYTALLLAVSLLPFVIHLSGILYLIGAVVLGSVFLVYTIQMQRERDNRLAMPIFSYSIIYLMGLFLLLLLDRYWVLFGWFVIDPAL